MIPARLACLDLDTFFVSVERLLDPRLIGLPVIVGGSAGRGVVTSASYEARRFGVRSGMPVGEALRLCPELVQRPGRHGTYGGHSAQVGEIARRYCPVVQVASIDEFFLDFSGCESYYTRSEDADGDATIERVARELREAIQRECGLPASIGLGSSRRMAKMASVSAKPAGVHMVRAGQERAFVQELPVRRLPGLGPAQEAQLKAWSLHTLGDLLDLPPGPARMRFEGLQRSVQELVQPLRQQRLGRDRPAFQEHDLPGSLQGGMSNERTFHEDLGDPQQIEDQLRALCERVCWRIRRRELRARTIHLKLRYSDFETLTRSESRAPTDVEAEVYALVRQLYARARTRPLPIRLLGVGLSNFVEQERQVGLPFDGLGRARASAALDAVRARFGYEAVQLGGRPGSSGSVGGAWRA